MDQNITEASGQVVTVHKGWTNSKKLEEVSSERSKRPNHLPNTSIRRSSSSGDELALPAGSRSSLPKRLRHHVAHLIFEFVHGTDPFPIRAHSRSERPSIYAALLLSERDMANDRLTALLISSSLDEKLIAEFTKLTRFSRAVDFALSRTSVSIEPQSFVAETFEIPYELLSITEPELYMNQMNFAYRL